MGQSVEGSHIRRFSVGSQKLVLAEYDQEASNSLQNSSRLEIDHTLHQSPAIHEHTKKHLKDVRNGLRTSKDLLKVMNRIWFLEEHNSTCESLFTALKEEIDRASYNVNKLLQQQSRQSSTGSEIDILFKQFEEEKAARKFREHDRIHNAVSCIAGEFEREKKLRRQTERLNKKLGRELADTKASLSIVRKELENEKRAREILQQVCDELAKGIGEDRAEIEELKKRSEIVREEVEKEREMLQVADILREERVQMKLSEAKYEFEEKSVVVDMLRNELEAACLKTKSRENQDYGSSNFDKIKELERYLKETLPKTCQYRDQAEGENNLAHSDFPSIEMIDNRKSYEQTQRLSITSEGIELEFSPRKQDISDGFGRTGVFDLASGDWRKNYDDEIERYNVIKDLRDHIVSSTKSVSSPTKQWELPSFTPQGHKEVGSQGLPVMQGAV